MLHITSLLEELKASPYREITICAPHTGQVEFAEIAEGDRVQGPHGPWKEHPGTRLLTINRERNPKPLHAPEKGEISEIKHDLNGHFVQAGTHLMTLRHFLTREEVQRALLKRTLSPFCAPERAKYYFVPDIATKIRAAGCRAVTVTEGMDLLIMSRMKRESALPYHGPEGVIYDVYFKHNDNVDAGQALFGVCPPDQLNAIEEALLRVQTEWIEKE